MVIQPAFLQRLQTSSQRYRVHWGHCSQPTRQRWRVDTVAIPDVSRDALSRLGFSVLWPFSLWGSDNPPIKSRLPSTRDCSYFKRCISRVLTSSRKVCYFQPAAIRCEVTSASAGVSPGVILHSLGGASISSGATGTRSIFVPTLSLRKQIDNIMANWGYLQANHTVFRTPVYVARRSLNPYLQFIFKSKRLLVASNQVAKANAY